jgi:glycosyltransferase involved in cell wall biosynthesis
MKRFKILIFNWRDITHPWAGGAELHIHELAKRWVKHGHTVSLFCARYEGAKSFEELDGIEIIRKGGKFSVYLAAVWAYMTQLRKREYDLIVDDINGIPWFTPVFTRKPKVAIMHHLVKGIFFKELPLLLALIGYSIEACLPFVYRKTPFITVSESSKQELVTVGIPEKHITIVNNGIDHRLYKPNEYSKSPFPHILYLGRLRDYKRLDLLVKAMPSIINEIPDVKLSIVGTGEAEDNLKTLTTDLRLADSITFYGYADEEEKVEFLQNAWLFVSPSEKEGWGLTVIEANACGTPAVAFDVPGLQDSIKDGQTGLLVADGESDALAVTIVKLLKDDTLRAELGMAALNYAQQFNWDKTAEEFMAVLERVVNEK